MILFDKGKYRKVDSHKIEQGSYNAVQKSSDADWPQRSLYSSMLSILKNLRHERWLSGFIK